LSNPAAAARRGRTPPGAVHRNRRFARDGPRCVANGTPGGARWMFAARRNVPNEITVTLSALAVDHRVRFNVIPPLTDLERILQ